jgi:nitrogen fixation protein FixH
MIKKSMVAVMAVLMLIFIVGCLDYKTYDNQNTDNSDDSLINEIAQLEEELGLSDTGDESPVELENPTEVMEEQEPIEVVEDVVLPELGQEDFVSTEPDVINVKENELVKLNVLVVDPDEDVVTYTFGKPLDENGQWQTNYGDAGEYFVTISATDGKLTTDKDVKIVVQRVNVPPIIAVLQDRVVKEGEVVKFTPDVSDPNNDALTVQVTEPLKSGVFTTDHTSAGEYQIRVTATDGELSSEASFKLTIQDVNELPIITEVEDITINEGETVTIKPVVTDLDEDPITLTISEPVGDDGVWETRFVDHGEYFITVSANDGKDVVNKRIKLLVQDVNMPPEILEVNLVTS